MTKLYSDRGWCVVMPAKGSSKPLVLTGTFSRNMTHCWHLLTFWADQARPEAIDRFGPTEADWWSGYPESGDREAKVVWLMKRGFRCDLARVEVTPSVLNR